MEQHVQVAAALGLGGRRIGVPGSCSRNSHRCPGPSSSRKLQIWDQRMRSSLATFWPRVFQPPCTAFGPETWPSPWGEALLHCDSGRGGEAASTRIGVCLLDGVSQTPYIRFRDERPPAAGPPKCFSTQPRCFSTQLNSIVRARTVPEISRVRASFENGGCWSLSPSFSEPLLTPSAS